MQQARTAGLYQISTAWQYILLCYADWLGVQCRDTIGCCSKNNAALAIHELLHERFDPGRPRPAPPSPETVEATIRATFGVLDPSGKMAAECWRDYSRKLALWTASEARFDDVRARWDDEIGPRSRELVRPAATISAILGLAGHPRTFEALTPPIPRDEARFALGNAHLIRERFVIGDLLWWLGLVGPTLADDLLAAGDTALMPAL